MGDDQSITIDSANSQTMDEQNENSMSSPNPFQIIISWDAVCERYAGRFRDQFQGKRKVRQLSVLQTKWNLK